MTGLNERELYILPIAADNMYGICVLILNLQDYRAFTRQSVMA